MDIKLSDYMAVSDAAQAWGITKRRVLMYLADERIPGAARVGNIWLIPKDAAKPDDGRKNNRRWRKASKPKDEA